MKILVLADSRGMWPRERNWPGMLAVRLGSQHQVHAYVSGVDCWLGDLHMMENHLLTRFPNEQFDLIIHQGGWHEGGPCFWPSEIWENITNTPHRKFNPSALTHQIVSLRDGKTKYQYIDRNCERAIFDVFKKHAKRILIIGMGALRPPNDLDVEYKLGLDHFYDVLKTNDVFMSYGHDSMNMPMDETWINENTGADRIHYNAQGSDFLSEYLVRYINRLGLTLNSVIKKSETHNLLYENACRIGSSITNHTEPGDVVLISKKSSEDLLAPFLGCILYGRMPLIIQHPSHKVSTTEFRAKMLDIKNQIHPKICLCDTKYLPDFSEFFNSTDSFGEPEKVLPVANPLPDDVAFLQLSSGTTGSVKILKVKHKDVIENCFEYGNAIQLNKRSKIVSWLPLYHDMGLITSFLMPMVFDCDVKLMDPFEWVMNPESLLVEISNFKGTHIWMPNFAFSHITKHGIEEKLTGIDLSSVSHFISCSEPTYLEDCKQFLEKFSKHGLGNVLSNCYALAENVFAATQSDGIKTTVCEGKEFVSCGKPISGVSILILDENGKDITDQKSIGRIVLKSNSVVSNEKCEFGYYPTGDLGFVEEGELFVVGREKDAFVSYGNNIYPNLIEQSIKHDLIVDGRIACFGIPDSNIGTEKVGVVVETEHADQTPKIQSDIAESVKSFVGVSPIVFVEEPMFLIKTSSGKISRSRTRDKVLLKSKIVNHINDFLKGKNKPQIKSTDRLWSSGLLDSLDMFELVLYFDKIGIPMNKEKLTPNSSNIELQSIDTVDGILKNL